MLAIDLSTQQEIDANWGENVNDNTIMVFIFEEEKETILDFSQGTVKMLWMCSTVLFF